MIYQIVAVRDAALDGFGRPFFSPSLGAAVRSFSDEVSRNAADNLMFQHPEDYDLYHIGSFDDSTGEVSSMRAVRLVVGSQVKR